MSIHFNEKTRMFGLQAGKSTYLMQLSPQDDLYHLYYGARVHFDAAPENMQGDGFSPLLDHGGGVSFSPDPPDKGLSLDTVLQEYPGAGVGDFREAAIAVRDARGARAVHLKYKSHQILAGQKPDLQGLPHTYLNEKEADTLAICLADELLGLRITLYYCAFQNQNVITRWAVAENVGQQNLTIESLQSTCVEFAHSDYHMVDLTGAWSRERRVERHPLYHGSSVLQSRRGSTGHQINCFAALTHPQATETTGEVFGFNLVYSSNFRIAVECPQMHTARLTMGISPEGFAWRLEPGETFVTPEAVMVYSGEGLGGMSRSFHDLYRENLVRGKWKNELRPLIINAWEPCGFNFNGQRLIDFAHAVKDTGVDLLVMDDGWFGERYDDHRGLGDWVLNEKRMGMTLKQMVDGVNAEGLGFGIWFEPEMVNPDSDLYRAHPEWTLHIPGRGKSTGRDQCVLDLGLPAVQAYLFDALAAVLHSANITYVKWDFNRNLTEVYSTILPPERQGEVYHRYVLGLYSLMERLVQAFPEVLFNSCSGGGGRYDPGMLYYMPNTWGSDNTDPVRRLQIQYGTSMVYPCEGIGSHVSGSRAHYVDLKFRAEVAMFGTFGYELDPTKLSPEQKDEMRKLNEAWRGRQAVLAKGDLYRLLSPFRCDSNTTADAAWMFVSKDKSRAVFQYFCLDYEPNHPGRRIYLQGLDPDALYRVDGREVHGDTLMHGGLRFKHVGLYGSRTLDITRV